MQSVSQIENRYGEVVVWLAGQVSAYPAGWL